MTVEIERRATERHSLPADVDFRRAKETAFRITLHDVSPEGCRIEAPVTFANGERVWVKLPGLESLQSHVCWSSQWVAGAKFEQPMHPAVFDMITRRLRAA